MGQQGLDFSKKISKRKIIFCFVFYRCSHGLSKTQREKSKIFFPNWSNYCSSTLKFLQFCNQNVVNILFLVVKSLKVTSGFNSKHMKINFRRPHHWNIWHLSVKNKISPLLGRLQGSQGCQKMHHYPLKLDLKVWCSNIQSFLMASRSFLIFIQFWLNIRALNLQIQV